MRLGFIIWLISTLLLSVSVATVIRVEFGCINIKTRDELLSICDDSDGADVAYSGNYYTFKLFPGLVPRQVTIEAGFPNDPSPKTAHPTCMKVFTWPLSYGEVIFTKGLCVFDSEHNQIYPSNCCDPNRPYNGPDLPNPYLNRNRQPVGKELKNDVGDADSGQDEDSSPAGNQYIETNELVPHADSAAPQDESLAGTDNNNEDDVSDVF